MNGYNFDWDVVAQALPSMLQGLGLTLQITVITIVISMILAIPVAVGRMSKIEVIRWAAQGYIEIFRCTPLLVQLFWIFYALPALTGVTLPGYASAVIALTANLTAFMAETYRSGFQSVPVEQVEAGRFVPVGGSWARFCSWVSPYLPLPISAAWHGNGGSKECAAPASVPTVSTPNPMTGASSPSHRAQSGETPGVCGPVSSAFRNRSWDADRASQPVR